MYLVDSYLARPISTLLNQQFRRRFDDVLDISFIARSLYFWLKRIGHLSDDGMGTTGHFYYGDTALAASRSFCAVSVCLMYSPS